MIWFWLVEFIRKIVKLIRIPNAEEFAIVAPNAKCPVCGHNKGHLRCVLVADPGPNPPKNLQVPGSIKCQHSCEICGARWFDKPIVSKVDSSMVLPCVARTELEAAEDKHRFKLIADEPR